MVLSRPPYPRPGGAIARAALLAASLAAAHAGLAGCAWTDEEVPGQVIVEPVRYGREPVMPGTPASLRGFRLSATTAQIQAFLGRRDFRIAVSLYDGSPGIYVLDPGEPGTDPRIRRFSDGRETFTGREDYYWSRCALSPGGNSLVYSLGGGWGNSMPILWLLHLAPGQAWRVPVLSAANGGYGMRGDSPFWRVSGDRSFIGFHGAALPHGGEDGLTSPGFVGEAQEVEALPDGSVSPPAPLLIGGVSVGAAVGGVSGDGRWVLIQGSSDMSSLIPADTLPGLDSLESIDRLPGFYVGRRAALNPFDPSVTGHTDYHATFPYSLREATGNKWDTLLDPRTLDGRRVDSAHPLAGHDFWICDGDRRIVISAKVGARAPAALAKTAVSPVIGYDARAVWSSHPNFVLVHASGFGAWIVKLAESETELYGDPGARTRTAAGVLRLLQADAGSGGDFHAALMDMSLWIGGE